jgi:serine/threonine protein kinase
MSVVHGTSGVDASPIPGYEILQTLNEGGMGRVYLAKQHALNRLVCVKTMSIPAGVDAESCCHSS